ncbi:MAG: hypothetical protein SFU98_21925 [Leptospiraceae bacterium]|nr:hypothetical protein [Leptospiraceae bacterium]
MNFWQRLSIKKRIPIVLLLFLSLVKLSDYIIFDKAFYSFPNELEWDTSHWYNFEHNRKKVIPKSQSPVLITGSSIALYSALPKVIESELKAKDKNHPVHLYSHVALSPTDLSYYIEDVIQKKPSLVLYILHSGDFQLDYFDYKFKKAEHEKYTVESVGEIDEKRRIRDYPGRYPTKFFYPFKFVLENGIFELGKDFYFSLLTKSLLNSNTIRSFLKDPFKAYNERHYRKGKSYHNYTGKIPFEGIWRKGWTREEFTIECEIGNGNFKDSIYLVEPARIKIAEQGKEIFNQEFPKSGWKEISIPFPNKEKVILKFESNVKISSKKIDPKNYGKEYFYGMRLTQNFCRKEIERDIAFDRRESLEDITLLEMTLDEYKSDYQNRLYKDIDKRFELGRLNLIRQIKKSISSREFKPWSEFFELEKIAKRLNQEKIPFIVINNPENPLEDFYGDRVWFNGYLKYLEKLSVEEKFQFIDLSNTAIEPRYFIDENHLTTIGAKYLSKVYAEYIGAKL